MKCGVRGKDGSHATYLPATWFGALLQRSARGNRSADDVSLELENGAAELEARSCDVRRTKRKARIE